MTGTNKDQEGTHYLVVLGVEDPWDPSRKNTKLNLDVRRARRPWGTIPRIQEGNTKTMGMLQNHTIVFC